MEKTSHLDDAAGNLETRVEANLQRSFANQPKTNDARLADERHLHETAEPGGVVVPDGLGIAKGLEDGVGLEDLLLNPR